VLRSLQDIIRAIVAAGYRVYWSIVTSKDYGSPQSRPRVYVVAVRNDSLKHEFMWPEPVALTQGVASLLEIDNMDRKYKQDLCKGARKRLHTAVKHIKQHGGNPRTEPWCVDVDSSEDFCHWHRDCSPCITKSRGCHGFYVTSIGGMMSMEEIMKLQGYDPRVLNWKQSGIPRTTWGQAIGDSMSLNVLRPILLQGCVAAGLI
jgi:site-specific DNA-cytosine methylase